MKLGVSIMPLHRCFRPFLGPEISMPFYKIPTSAPVMSHMNPGDILVFRASTMVAAFWNVATCSLVDGDRRFRGSCCIHHQGDVTHLPDNGGSKKL
jgi:hypothetical protein